MVALAEHWTNATHLKHQPFNGRPLCFWFIRPEFSSLLSEIHHDRAGLHQGFAIFVIDNCRYFIIGAYFQKFGSQLLILCDVDCMDVEIQSTLLQHQRDFSSIRRKPCIKIYHSTVSSGFRVLGTGLAHKLVIPMALNYFFCHLLITLRSHIRP